MAMFGPIMQITQEQGRVIKMRPWEKAEAAQFLDGYRLHSVTRYIGPQPKTIEDMEARYASIGSHGNKDDIEWGIYVVEESGEKLIGASNLHGYRGHWNSGILIFRPEYWGKGITTACHRARTMYAINQMNLREVRSGVSAANTASLKALLSVGYIVTGVNPCDWFIDGVWVHGYSLLLVNPELSIWKTYASRMRELSFLGLTGELLAEARTRTLSSLDWASKHVVLL